MSEKGTFDGSPSPHDRSKEINQHGAKHLRRLRNGALAFGLLGVAGGVSQSEMVQTEWRKINNADSERAEDLAQRVMELSDAVEEDGPEIFKAKLDFHLQVLVNAGESKDRVSTTKQFFTDFFDQFQAIAKIEKDKKKVLFGMFQRIGRYVPGKARISDIANEDQGNCDARTQALTLLVSGIYPELPLKVQFFGASDVKKTEAHSRVLVNIDGKWYSLEGEPVEVPEADMKGTVLAESTVFEASVAFGNNEEQLIKKTNATLVSDEKVPEKNPDDGNFGNASNTLFDVSVFTKNAVETYGEGCGLSQAESIDAYNERMKSTPDFGVINLDLVDSDDMHKKEYERVPLPEEIKEKALKEASLFLDAWNTEEQRYIELPFYDVRKFLRDNNIKRLLVRSADLNLIDQYYSEGDFHFNFVSHSNRKIFYFRSSFDDPSKLFDNNDVKILRIGFDTDLLETEDFFHRNFDDLESFELSYSGKVRLPNFGDKLESASLIQDIKYPQDIVSLQDLQPLFEKNLKRLKITVYAYGVNVQRIPFSSKDLREKNIVAEGGDIQIHFENQ